MIRSLLTALGSGFLELGRLGGSPRGRRAHRHD